MSVDTDRLVVRTNGQITVMGIVVSLRTSSRVESIFKLGAVIAVLLAAMLSDVSIAQVVIEERVEIENSPAALKGAEADSTSFAFRDRFFPTPDH